jgi:hypothetical protein
MDHEDTTQEAERERRNDIDAGDVIEGVADCHDIATTCDLPACDLADCDLPDCDLPACDLPDCSPGCF